MAKIKTLKDINNETVYPQTVGEAIVDGSIPGSKIDLSFILDKIYPVGSVYMSVNNVSPETFLGGTWERLTGAFLYTAVSSSEKGNGEGTITNNHTITVEQMPSHSHLEYLYYSGDATWKSQITSYPRAIFGSGGTVTSSSGAIGQNQVRYTYNVSSSAPYQNAFSMPAGDTKSSGGGQGHSHKIPYMSVFTWKRTA